MKINRRGFISLGLGASAGLTLSPVPWKLLDDLSIWTQNWPWVPVPKDGRESFVHSVCTLCPGGCGITVRKIDERVVSVAGKADYPVNKGGICPLGLSGPQLLYTPVRVMSPMLRVNGEFQPVSWDKALSVMVARLDKIRNLQQPQRLACLTDTDQGIESGLLKRFLNAFGSTSFFHMPSAEDAWEAVTETLTGNRFIPGYDLENADTILSFGCGLVEGWGSPVHSTSAHSLWKEKGSTFIQIEPRLSNTAAAADRWIAIKPGSEADLAFGICRALVDQFPAYRQRLINDVKNGLGFHEYLKSHYSPGRVEQATGLSGSVVDSLAKDFAASKRPLALCGKGEGRSPIESREILSILLLNVLAGNINQPGGFHCLNRQDYIAWPDVNQTNVNDLNQERQKGKITSPEEMIHAVAEASDPPIEMLLVSGGNPCYTMKGADKVSDVIQKIPFVVSFSTHWDETAVKADLVLPNHSHLERYQDFPIYGGLTQPKLGLSKPVSKKLFDTRQTGDVVIELAKQLGGSLGQAFTWKNHEHCLKETLKDQWQALNNHGFADLEQTPKADMLTLNPAGFEKEPIRLQGDKEKYPLTLVPKTSMRLNSGAVGSPPFMVKVVEDTVLRKNQGAVDLHPQTAVELNLAEGEPVQLTTPEGQAEVSVHLDEGTMPGLVVMAEGLGHSAFDKYLAGKGVNVNRLLGQVKDPLTGQNVAWGIRAKLRKV